MHYPSPFTRYASTQMTRGLGLNVVVFRLNIHGIWTRRCRYVSCKPRLKMVLVLLVASLVVGALAFGNWLYNGWCSEADAHETLRTLCGMYARGQVAGNMCPALCEESKLTFIHCAGNIYDKKVIIMSMRDPNFSRPQTVVLKVNRLAANWSPEFLLDHLKTTERMSNCCKEFIVRKFRWTFNIDVSRHPDLLSYIWRQDFDSFVSKSGFKETIRIRTETALQSLLALAKQNEYVNMLVLNTSYLPIRNITEIYDLPESVDESQITPNMPIRNVSAISGMPEIAETFRMSAYMPRLHGSCGPAYIVDNTPSLILSAHVLFQGKSPEILSYTYVPWSERASVALQLQEMIKHLESSDNPHLIHCDLVPHNIGLDHRKHVVLLDVDTILYNRIYPDYMACTEDAQCDFKKCTGRCDLATRQCVKGLVRSHLQMLCRHIFVTPVSLLGLLRGPPLSVASKLQRLLWQCSFHSNDNLSLKSDDVMRQSIIAVLKESLEDET